MTAAITALGMTGMAKRSGTTASLASVSMLLLMIWAKIASDLFGLPAPDTGVLLLQFMLVIFLMEASNTALSFRTTLRLLENMNDVTSTAARKRWVSQS